MQTLEESYFYSILDTAYVPRSKWVPTYQALLGGGADLVQIRAKDASHEERLQLLECLLPDSALSGKPLIINDDIEAAGCYPGMNLGLHLGQEDLQSANKEELQKAGVNLGTSTHNEAELEYALSFDPAYVALGPVYNTISKKMVFEPQGVERVRQWKEKLGDIPLVGIGGIRLETAQAVLQAGADAVACIGDVTHDANPEERACEWVRALN